MAESHVVSALKAKRAELAGEIEGLERQVDQPRAALVHLDATLRLFDSKAEPEAIPPRHQRGRDDWFGRGELARRVFKVLRDAGEPLCAREVALRIMAAKGLDPDDSALAGLFTKRVAQALRRQLARRALHRESGPGQTMLWSVAG